jgi:hypothetical protein
VLFFDDVGAVADQRSSLQDFLTSMTDTLGTQISYVIETSGREMDTSTGTLTGQWSESTPYVGVGDVSGGVVADATQLLARWRTGQVVGGRFLQGRTFFPGMTTAALSNGNVAGATISTLNGFIASYLASAAPHGVWHRPTDGSPGVFFQATSGDFWPELAVLRKRRG